MSDPAEALAALDADVAQGRISLPDYWSRRARLEAGEVLEAPAPAPPTDPAPASDPEASRAVTDPGPGTAGPEPAPRVNTATPRPVLPAPEAPRVARRVSGPLDRLARLVPDDDGTPREPATAPVSDPAPPVRTAADAKPTHTAFAPGTGAVNLRPDQPTPVTDGTSGRSRRRRWFDRRDRA